MVKKEVCEICLEGIKNPICNKCRLLEFEYWIKVSSIDKNTRSKIINDVKKKLSQERFSIGNDSDSKCIICGKEYLSICNYCYFYAVSKIIDKYKVSKDDKYSFFETFNYRFLEEDEYENKDDLILSKF